MDFFNREKELRRLQRALSGKKAKLIVLYGRRRCGKSTLIRKVLREEDYYFMAPQADEAVQRNQLATVIGSKINGFDRVIYPDWESLFVNFNNSLPEPVTLFLDEFPYLVKSSTGLPSVLQKVVDQMKERKFHLVLCGSSQQMMYGLVLEGTAPLYGRSDEIIKVLPLEAGWIRDSLQCSSVQAVIEFATWGGVPRYWELRSEYRNYEEAVKEILLDRLGVLHEEPTRLFLDDMRESVQAYSIMAVVGKGSHKLSEIASRLQKPATQLSRLLNRLIELGYLIREMPFGESTKSNKRSLYKIQDPFMNFYFSFVSPNLSRLELGLTDQIYSLVEPSLNSFVAQEWELLCRRSVPLAPFSGIDFDRASRWWGNNARGETMEIDLVAESFDKKHLLVGECKWKMIDRPEMLLDQLQRKGELLPFADKKNILPVLFAKTVTATKGYSNHLFTPGDVLDRLRF